MKLINFQKINLLFIVLILTGLIAAQNVSAETFYVCPGCQFTDIQEAIDNAFDGDTIIVAPGTYTEPLILGKDIVLSGSGPEKTILNVDGNAITCAKGTICGKIKNFYIQATNYGIYCNQNNDITIKNNVIEGCKSGICARGGIGRMTIINNNILGSTDHGINLKTTSGQIHHLQIINNIVALNSSYAIYNKNGNIHDGVNNFEIIHNNFSGNTDGRCHNNSGLNSISCDDPSNISENPQFVDRFSGNYCLQPSSPCVDAGRQGVAYNDPDNSRNDIGAYGGPDAMGCSFGGPVVTEMEVSPGAVAEGKSVTVRAKGTAR